MTTSDEQGHIDRITDRLRRDHPDPKMREQLYEKDDLIEYVRTLMPPGSDDALIERVAVAVRAAEDGQPAT